MVAPAHRTKPHDAPPMVSGGRHCPNPRRGAEEILKLWERDPHSRILCIAAKGKNNGEKKVPPPVPLIERPVTRTELAKSAGLSKRSRSRRRIAMLPRPPLQRPPLDDQGRIVSDARRMALKVPCKRSDLAERIGITVGQLGHILDGISLPSLRVACALYIETGIPPQAWFNVPLIETSNDNPISSTPTPENTESSAPQSAA